MNRRDIKLTIDRCVAHDVPDAADLIESLAQQLAEAQRDAMRYRELRRNERFSVDEKCSDGQWEPIHFEHLDEALDKEFAK